MVQQKQIKYRFSTLLALGTLVVIGLVFVYITYLKFGTQQRHRDVFEVESGTKVLRITVRSNNPRGEPGLKLTEPDQEILEMDNPKLEIDTGPEWLIAEVKDPEVGRWELELFSVSGALLGNSFHYAVILE